MPESSTSSAVFMSPFFVSLRSMPESSRLFSLRSLGPLPSSTDKMSIHSSTGPIPRPIGCSPRVTAQSIFIPRLFPSILNLFARLLAFVSVSTLLSKPKGMSMTTAFAPMAAFFAITDARSWPSGSTERGYSPRMILSSVGAMSMFPPQTKHPPTTFIMSRILPTGISTLHHTSSVSAVPAGDVIALELVFGIASPHDAAMATMIGVTLLPGTPPIECLSTTLFPFHLNVAPVSIILLVMYISSLSVKSCIYMEDT